MYKIPWIFIPITIIYFIIIFIVMIIIGWTILKNKIDKEIILDAHKMCKNYDIGNIVPFGDITKFNRNNASVFINLNSAIAAWSGCDNPLPNVPQFDLIKTFQGYDYAAGFNRNIAALYYSKSLNIAILSFSGTMYLTEWANDFDFTQANPTEITNDTNILVHNKDYIMYKTLRTDFFNTLKGIKNDTTTVVITGHSLGGALSTICYLDIIENNIIPAGYRTLYSFASPRVGNVAFANIINSDNAQFRIANTEDIIIDLPLAITGQYIYEHTNSRASFSMNLGDYTSNHIDSYIDYLK